MLQLPLTGTFALPAAKLRRMTSLAPTFQRACGGAVAEVLPRVFLRNVLGVEQRPYACVSLGQSHGHRLIAGGDRNYLRPFGSLFLYLTIDVPIELQGDSIQAELFAGSFFGQVIDEISELSAADDPAEDESHLPIINIDLVSFAETAQEHWKSLGRFWYAGYHLEWGDG